MEQPEGKILGGTYRIERLLGEGGMGAVYQASHLRLRRYFAVKMLFSNMAAHQDITARFRREAEITSELGHPHIVEVIDFNLTQAGNYYIVMELLQGQDLDQLIQEQGQLKLERALDIANQVASALKAAHQLGVVHRDLKPSNIFICNNQDRPDYVKVVDFGISKVHGSQSALTGTQATMGTPSYMAPEQAEGYSAAVDARADIYALGTILYEMLAGKPPFDGDSIPSVLYKVVHQAPPPLKDLRSGLPVQLEKTIFWALQKKPTERPQDLDQFIAALNRTTETEKPDQQAVAQTLLADNQSPPAKGNNKFRVPSTLLASTKEILPRLNRWSRKSLYLFGGAIALILVGFLAFTSWNPESSKTNNANAVNAEISAKRSATGKNTSTIKPVFKTKPEKAQTAKATASKHTILKAEKKVNAPREERNPVKKSSAPSVKRRPTTKVTAPSEKRDPAQNTTAPLEKRAPAQKITAPSIERNPAQKVTAPSEKRGKPSKAKTADDWELL